MNLEETVNPQIDQVVPEMEHENVVADSSQQENGVSKEPQVIPLSALQKERRKRQEIEMENQWLKEQHKKSQQPEDNSQYESVTKQELGHSKKEITRDIEERIWIKNNPEKFEHIKETLSEFLQRRPNLKAAIEVSENRYEEAWVLMNALSPKQQQQLKAPVARKETPGSPASVPKAASLNQAVDVMNMTDSEYLSWRNSQKKRR